MSFSTLIKKIERSPEYFEEAWRAELSEAIFKAMEIQSVSKAELARRLGVSRAAVTQMLEGNNNFEANTIARIGYVLNIRWSLMIQRLTE